MQQLSTGGNLQPELQLKIAKQARTDRERKDRKMDGRHRKRKQERKRNCGSRKGEEKENRNIVNRLSLEDTVSWMSFPVAIWTRKWIPVTTAFGSDGIFFFSTPVLLTSNKQQQQNQINQQATHVDMFAFHSRVQYSILYSVIIVVLSFWQLLTGANLSGDFLFFYSILRSNLSSQVQDIRIADVMWWCWSWKIFSCMHLPCKALVLSHSLSRLRKHTCMYNTHTYYMTCMYIDVMESKRHLESITCSTEEGRKWIWRRRLIKTKQYEAKNITVVFSIHSRSLSCHKSCNVANFA